MLDRRGLSSVRVTGHFGEFLQGRMRPDGPVALVTLPCPAAWLEMRRVSDAGFGLSGTSLPRGPARRLGHALGMPIKGRYCARTSLPMGAGAGLSTAALLALASFGPSVPRTKLARACVLAEGASDPLMMPDPSSWLWASRAGRALRRVPPAPTFTCLAGLWGPCSRTDPKDTDFPDISDLVPRWEEAARARDLAKLAALATESAARCSQLRGVAGDPSLDLIASLGALGLARAHTGPARAFLYASGTVPEEGPARLRAAGYTHVFRFESTA
ncbi:propanediol utilization protein [Pseudaestuariivita sp.]|uniref:propanediol utilization protein n=1 Tax=Pseudaestuariivita sp. TaxID=2211669 RepID=UPI004058D273